MFKEGIGGLFLRSEEPRQVVANLYETKKLMQDLADRGMGEAVDIVQECVDKNLSEEELEEKLGGNEAIQESRSLQEIRSLLRKYKNKKK